MFSFRRELTVRFVQLPGYKSFHGESETSAFCITSFISEKVVSGMFSIYHNVADGSDVKRDSRA